MLVGYVYQAFTLWGLVLVEDMLCGVGVSSIRAFTLGPLRG